MNRALLAVFAVALVALAGCAPTAPQGPDLATPYIGGVQGLGISFAEGMPPVEIFDAGQTTFSVGLQVENLGESAIGLDSRNPNGYVELIGINPSQFGILQDRMLVTFLDAELALQGSRRGFDGAILPGDFALVEFSDLSYLPDRFGNTEVTIRANVCYEYRTYSDAELCFKDNVLENALDDTICTLTGAKPLSTSGGPVQVTTVTQNPAGSDRIHVTFLVENLGQGVVYAPLRSQPQPSFEMCASNAGTNPNRDVVYVEVLMGCDPTRDLYCSDTYDIRCPLLGGTNEGIVRMFNGAPATVTCTIMTDGRDGNRIFTDSLHVDLHYSYREYVETPVLVRDQNVGFVERGTDRI